MDEATYRTILQKLLRKTYIRAPWFIHWHSRIYERWNKREMIDNLYFVIQVLIKAKRLISQTQC